MLCFLLRKQKTETMMALHKSWSASRSVIVGVHFLLLLLVVIVAVQRLEQRKGLVPLIHNRLDNGEQSRGTVLPKLLDFPVDALTLDDEYRTLWTAGWNARYTKYYLNPPPIIRWTIDAEKAVEREFRRIHFPEDCSTVKGEPYSDLTI